MKLKGRTASALIAALIVASGLGFWRSGRHERSLSAASIAIEAQEWDEAIVCLDLAETNPKTRDRALLLRVRAMLAMGRPREAVKPLDELNPDGPLGAEVAFWKGRTLFAAGQSLLSVPWFQLAAAKKPGDPEIFRWLAASAYEQGAVSIALPALETVLRLEPEDARAWRTLAAIHKDYARFEQARDAYQEAAKLGGIDASARLEYAECLVNLAAYDEAEKQLKWPVGRAGEGAKACLQARCLRGRGETDGFEAFVREQAARFPKHAELLGLRSLADIRQGEFASALAWLDQAVAADPYRAESYYRRSQVLTRLERREEAEADRRKAEQLNNAVAEIAKLDELASRKPGDAALRSELGKLCATLGRFPLAASWYRAALACDPAHDEARRGLDSLRGLDK